MKIHLTAYRDDRHVHVYLGGVHLVTLKPVRESNAGHGDDSSYFESEEKAVIEETVAAWFKEKVMYL